MSYLRGQTAHVIQSVYAGLLEQLTVLGWADSTVDADGAFTQLPYGASTPISMIDYVPDATKAVAPNTVAFTSGDETDDLDDELGAASGGLHATSYVIFIDVFGESQGMALRIASDIKAILTGKLPGTSRYWPVYDYSATPVVTAEGHVLEMTRVERTKPENAEYKKNWQVCKVTVEHRYNAVEA